jgi:hypothetical protein
MKMSAIANYRYLNQAGIQPLDVPGFWVVMEDLNIDTTLARNALDTGNVPAHINVWSA